MATPAAALMLADARLPAGGHAHSGQLEAAVATGLVHDVSSMDRFIRGRVVRGGLVSAAFAARACAAALGAEDVWASLDVELDARGPSAAQRAASRQQGRTLMRAAQAAWPSDALKILARVPGGPHHALALGAVAGAARCQPADAALVAVYLSVTAVATAAVRLLGLDPLAVNAAVAALGDEMERVAALAATFATAAPRELPSGSGPVLDLLAEEHAHWEVRLFAS